MLVFRLGCIAPPAIFYIPPLADAHDRALILRHYVQSSPHLFDRSSMAKQNLSHRANVICDGSPSRIRMVRRISFGMTTRPRSSIRRTIPVAFIYISPLALFSFLLSAKMQKICGSKESQTNICTGQRLKFCRKQGPFSLKYS